MDRKIWLAAAVFCALLGGRAYVADMGNLVSEEPMALLRAEEETAVKEAPALEKSNDAPAGEVEEICEEKQKAETEAEEKKKKGTTGSSISPEQPLVIFADEMKYQSTSGDVSAEGDVDMAHMGEHYRTERIYGNNKTQHYVIPEAVHWTAPDNTAEAKSAEYDGLSGISTFSEFSGWHRGLYYYSGTDGVYNRNTNVATVQNAYFTTKSAVARVPDYRIEADSIDVYPGDKYVAHHPSLFIKNTRLITLGSYSGSLRQGSISIWSLIPTPTYDSHNGFGIKNAFEIPLGGVKSNLYFYTRLAWYTKQGFTPDVGFRYETPQGTFHLRYAKMESTENDDHIWLEKRPSFSFRSRNYHIAKTRLKAGFGGELGYWKQDNGPSGSYRMWEVWLRHDPIRLSSHLSLDLGVGYIHDHYGYQNTFRKNAYYTVGLRGDYGGFSAWADYRNNNQVGHTPYAFDSYDMTKPVSTGFRVQLTPRDAFSVNYSIDTVNGVLKHRDYTYHRDLHSFVGWIQYRSVDKEWKVMIQPKDFTF